MVNGHLYDALLTSGDRKFFTILPHIHPFMHTFTHGDSRLLKQLRSSVVLRDTSRLRRLQEEPRIELATFRLPANLLIMHRALAVAYGHSS